MRYVRGVVGMGMAMVIIGDVLIRMELMSRGAMGAARMMWTKRRSVWVGWTGPTGICYTSLSCEVNAHDPVGASWGKVKGELNGEVKRSTRC